MDTRLLRLMRGDVADRIAELEAENVRLRAMPDTDPAQQAAAALIAADIHVEPVGEELENWRVGDLLFSDAELVRLAVSRGLMSEDGE